MRAKAEGRLLTVKRLRCIDFRSGREVLRRKSWKRIEAAMLVALLLTGSAAGCQPAEKDVAGSLYLETAPSSSQAIIPETPSPAASPVTSGAPPSMSSDTASVRRSFIQALKATNQQTSFKRTVTRVLQVGEVELMRATESLQSAKGQDGIVQLGSLQASYKTETAGSLALEDISTYLENGQLYTRTTLEDSFNAANNRTNALAEPAEKSEAVAAVPAFYLQLTDKMISSVDISQNGSDLLYSFTLDPESCRAQVLELLEGQTDKLDFDQSAFSLDYNICTARSNADGLITELTSSIGGRYVSGGEERSGELSVKYAFSQLGTAKLPERPKWMNE